ncbi:hypothetical protein D9M73_183940 [compost metagenome]
MVHGNHPGTAVLPDIDVPLTGKTSKYFSHRGSRKPVPFADGNLIQRLVRIELHREDLTLEVVIKSALAVFHNDLPRQSNQRLRLVVEFRFARVSGVVNDLYFLCIHRKYCKNTHRK